MPVLKEEKRYAARVVRALARLYPEAGCSLEFSSPLELLVATILSAQCTDQRVNLVTRELFKKYRSAADYAAAGRDAELRASLEVALEPEIVTLQIGRVGVK